MAWLFIPWVRGFGSAVASGGGGPLEFAELGVPIIDEPEPADCPKALRESHPGRAGLVALMLAGDHDRSVIPFCEFSTAGANGPLKVAFDHRSYLASSGFQRRRVKSDSRNRLRTEGSLLQTP